MFVRTNDVNPILKIVKTCVRMCVKDWLEYEVVFNWGNGFVFVNSHKKCVSRHALSRLSSVKRALFTSPLAAKSRLSVDKTPIATSKGKSKKASLPPKLVLSIKSKLKLLHMDLCGPMRVASIKGKKYIRVIVDDYSRYTWVYFLGTKDEALDMIVDFVNQNPVTCVNFNNSSEDSQSVPSTSDLDNLFGPMYEEYYATRSQEVPDNSATHTLANDNTSSSSSIIVEHDDAPPIVFSLKEQVDIKPNSLVLNEVTDEFVQEDVADFDGNMFHNAPPTLEFDVSESSSTYQDPSNMHQFHQQHRSIDRWTKNHPLEQVIGDPLKPVMTRKRL
ncbi:gag-pol polyprotein [Tanacetum coccineum]|uniref:Gag-pol polyprotein n=1 Tax=Tanacetum coccineum TaxID=301880 RepID=A0ABQ5GWC7_9ASTR